MKTFVKQYSTYNAWANAKLVAWLSKMDTELLYRPTPSSFPTIDGTLQHMLRAQKFWCLFITEQDTAKFSWASRPNEVEQILKELNAVSSEMKTSFSAFNNDQLHEPLYLNMPWSKNNLRRFEYIVHVINHSTYHRGQIVTMARALGFDEGVPNTDYNMFHTP